MKVVILVNFSKFQIRFKIKIQKFVKKFKIRKFVQKFVQKFKIRLKYLEIVKIHSFMKTIHLKIKISLEDS